MAVTREDALAMDAADALAPFRSRFAIDADDDRIYLVGNSLGRLPRSTVDRLRVVVDEEWGRGLVGSWWDRDWLDLPVAVGNRLAPLLGASAGEVIVSDSTTVNLYKLAWAAAVPGRARIVTDAGNFPTDRYVLAAVAAATGREYVEIESPSAPLPDDVALASFSLVDYRSSEIVGRVSTDAPVVWDLSHAAGIVPLPSWVELAVGCTYKYLNGGPGAPAFVLDRSGAGVVGEQPIRGWFAQQDQFDMGPSFSPHPDIRRFLVGTPPVLSLAACDEGVRLSAEAGVDAIRAKSVALTSLLIDLADERGLDVISPRDSLRRGGHVALRHPDARRLEVVLAERWGVLTDFRAPDVIRLAPAPLYTRFVDVWDALRRIALCLS